MNTKHKFSIRHVSLCVLLVLVGCAQEQIRSEAASQLREGKFEAALKSYQEGTERYPESVALRSGLLAAKTESITRLVTDAAQLRARGQFDEADSVVNRALALDPKNERVTALQTDIAIERMQRQRLIEALALAKANKKEDALKLIDGALRQNPRHGELLALQRRLENETRFDNPSSGRRELAETRQVTLDFRGAPLSTVLDAIARSSGINFILDRDVKQDARVTVFLRSAKVEDAIDLIAAIQQLGKRIVDPQTVLIYPNTPEKQKEHQEQVIRVFHLASAEARSTAGLLRSMLRIKEPFIDERANLIAIRETPEIIALAERLVALHDVSDAEVMLEVEVLEIRTSRLTELGINFPSSIGLTPLTEAGTTTQTLSSISNLNPDRIGVSVAGLLIKLRREVGDFNILANPRIRAKSREKARILIGDKVPVITATTNQTGFVADSVNYLDVGLKLEVEPVVSPDDDVTIKLALEVSSLSKEVHTTSGTLAYQIGTRNANTTLRLRDGETQLLGGLINNEDRSSANRVPGLGDLPIAGRLFSSQLDDVQRTELVLAITPRILRSAPRPDVSQAELWVGTEMATRLRASPAHDLPAAKLSKSVASNPDSMPKIAPPQAQSNVGNTSAASTQMAASPRVSVQWQGPQSAKAGETFDVVLDLNSALPLRGAPIEVLVDPALIELVNINEASFFQQDGGVTSFTHSFDKSSGRLGVAVLRKEDAGIAGSAPFIKLTVRAKAAGSATFKINGFKPLSSSGTPEISEPPAYSISIK